MGKEEISRNEQFLLFPQFGEFSAIFFFQTLNCRLLTLSVWKSLKYVVGER